MIRCRGSSQALCLELGFNRQALWRHLRKAGLPDLKRAHLQYYTDGELLDELAKAGCLTHACRRLKTSPARLREELARRGLEAPFRRRRLEGLPDDVILRLIEEHGGIAKAAAQTLGVSEQCFQNERQLRGIRLVEPGRGRPRLWAKHEPEIRRLHAQGWGAAAIARATAQPFYRVYQALRIMGLERQRVARARHGLTPKAALPPKPQPTDSGWESLPMDVAKGLV